VRSPADVAEGGRPELRGRHVVGRGR
jgi:hypothetical protein